MKRRNIIMPTKKNETPEAPQSQMVELDHVKAVANKVFSEFTNQELGNKVSQFNMQGLVNIFLGMVQNPDSLKVQAQPQPEKKDS